MSAIESELSDGTPFGSYEYLSRHLSAVYRKLLSVVAEQSLAAEELLRAISSNESGEILFRDSLVRRTIEDGVCTTVRGLDAIDQTTLDAVLFCAAENATTGRRSVLDATARCIPLGSANGHGFVWADDHPNTVSGGRFVEEVLKRIPGFHIEVPTDDQVETLVAGQDLALRIAPRIARSAMSHLFMVILGDFEDGQPPINALTVPGLPGVILVSPKALSSTAAVAETLVHESQHLKFLDIEYVHPLFALGFRPYSSPRITPVWHRDDEQYGGWPIDRLLTSMHVYLSLAVFYGIAIGRRHDHFYAADHCTARAETCRERATWLFETAQDYLDYLSAAGREFVVSIGAMLDKLDASSAPDQSAPPPVGAAKARAGRAPRRPDTTDSAG